MGVASKCLLVQSRVQRLAVRLEKGEVWGGREGRKRGKEGRSGEERGGRKKRGEREER